MVSFFRRIGDMEFSLAEEEQHDEILQFLFTHFWQGDGQSHYLVTCASLAVA